MTKELPSPYDLRKLLRYEPDTGKLFWLSRGADKPQWNARYEGKEAFTCVNTCGHKMGGIWGKSYYAHRVIWAMQTGEWPNKLIDHKDMDPSNNKWGNLREATQSENGKNRKPAKRGTSKFLGVCWDKRRNRWIASIQSNGARKHIGYYDCEVKAAKAYDAAAIKLHGVFARPNFYKAQLAKAMGWKG